MQQPVYGSSPSENEPGSFNFASKLEFEAKSNLRRTRSDTCLRNYGSRSDTPPKKPAINPWTVPAIDFTRQEYKPKYSWFEGKKNQHQNKKRRNKDFMKITVPKILEKPVSLETPFVTTFRSPSARTARIIGVKEGTNPAGPYKPWGPHAFRGDDFRPNTEIRNNKKPPFVTSYTRDPRNLEIQRKSISVHAGVRCLDRDEMENNVKGDRPKPFLTSLKQQPNWDQDLILTKERYQRGLTEDEIRMNRIMKQLSWYSATHMSVPRLDRPDNKDHKTVDWLQITQHSKDETTVLR